MQNNPPEPLIIDGHLSHHLPSDAVVVLRCSPDILKKNVKERIFRIKNKINCDWETLGSSWNERQGDVPWTEYDNGK